MNKIKRESLEREKVATFEDLAEQWRKLKNQRQQLHDELRIIESLISDQEALIACFSSFETKLVSRIERLCEFKKIHLDKIERLAQVNADIYWHTDYIKPNLSAQTIK